MCTFLLTDQKIQSQISSANKKSDFGTKMDGCADSLGCKNKYKNIRNSN